jgi:sugar phosphate isomerase/epimerase
MSPSSPGTTDGTSADKPGAPKLAFGSWAFSFGPFADNPWSFDRLCAYAAEAGYDGVEINGFRPHPHQDDFDDDAKAAALRTMMEDAGVAPSGYAPDFTAAPPAEVPGDRYLKEVDAARAFCERMGISILRVDTVSSPDPLPADEYERRFDRLVSTWREAAERCRTSGVTVVWEFEPGFWLNRPSDVLRLVQAVDDVGFRILFDSSHAYTGAVAGGRQGPDPELLPGGVVEYAKLLEPYVGHLHLIDSDGSLHHEETSDHLPFGTGNVDFPAVLRALEPALSRLEWWGIDFCFCPTTEVDARNAVPFVRSLAREHQEAATA